MLTPGAAGEELAAELGAIPHMTQPDVTPKRFVKLAGGGRTIAEHAPSSKEAIDGGGHPGGALGAGLDDGRPRRAREPSQEPLLRPLGGSGRSDRSYAPVAPSDAIGEAHQLGAPQPGRFGEDLQDVPSASPRRHGSDPSTAAGAFDPGVYRDRRYRAHLIATGRLVPLEARATLRMDARGHAVARRHAEQGDFGRKVLALPAGYFELPIWHVRALEARDRRIAAVNARLRRSWPE